MEQANTVRRDVMKTTDHNGGVRPQSVTANAARVADTLVGEVQPPDMPREPRKLVVNDTGTLKSPTSP